MLAAKVVGYLTAQKISLPNITLQLQRDKEEKIGFICKNKSLYITLSPSLSVSLSLCLSRSLSAVPDIRLNNWTDQIS